ncbi:MAG: hypothetical protein JXB30_01210 [Anaerolineae bacterium]|nr:hypothetical protein [Anaerolineae bacterium]
MSINRLPSWLVLSLMLVLLIMACTCSGASEATQVVSPVATEEKLEVTQEEPSSVAFVLSDEIFIHSSGAFAVYLPDGWVTEERDDGIAANDPDDTAALDISFTNIGVSVDDETLGIYIDAIEANWFASFENYNAYDPEIQGDGSILMPKDVSSGGKTWTILSYYWQEGTVVYQQDFWVLEDLYDDYLDSLLAIANSMETDAAAGEDASLYAFRYSFTGPDGLFSFDVPYGLTYVREESDEDGMRVIIDSWTSPDGQMTVESLLYDEGEEVSRSLAGAIALELLRQFYASDLKVIDDLVQPDGSERLMWNSAEGNYSGTTFFETRGTSFLFLTWFADDDHYDLYEPIWLDLVESYDIP